MSKRCPHWMSLPYGRRVCTPCKRARSRERNRPTTVQLHWMGVAHVDGLEVWRCPKLVRERLVEEKLFEEVPVMRVYPKPLLRLTKEGERQLFKQRPHLQAGEVGE